MHMGGVEDTAGFPWNKKRTAIGRPIKDRRKAHTTSSVLPGERLTKTLAKSLAEHVCSTEGLCRIFSLGRFLGVVG